MSGPDGEKRGGGGGNRLLHAFNALFERLAFRCVVSLFVSPKASFPLQRPVGISRDDQCHAMLLHVFPAPDFFFVCASLV